MVFKRMFCHKISTIMKKYSNEFFAPTVMKSHEKKDVIGPNR